MTSNVSAVVLFHDEPESLQLVLEQLEKQSLAPVKILIVDTSRNSQVPPTPHEVLRLSPKSNFAQSINAAFNHLNPDGFLWVLHDDSAPDSQALQRLVSEAELSPSLAVIGPKQVDWDNKKLIRQLGLTLTRSGRLFSRVRGEFDQGQHDNVEDVLAVGTAGMLINAETFRSLNGFDTKAPALASDVDFSIRARLQGFRVAVAPSAKISHKMLSMAGARELSWLGANPKTAIRRAELYLALTHANLAVFILSWLLLVPLALLSCFGLLLRKRGDDVPSELAGAVAAFFDFGRMLSSRSLIRRTTTFSLGTLAELRATRAEVKADRQRAKDQLISNQLLTAHARGEQDVMQQGPADLLGSGAIWWALGLVALNFLWFPSGVATTGAGVLPLSGNWLEIFNQAGSPTTGLGLGFEAPSDPFVWVLALISLPTFFEPSLAITLVLFLASAIAFLGAFKLTELVSSKNSVRVVSGLAYALWPSITISISETRFPQVLAQLLLPWFLLAVARLVGIGNSSPNQYHSRWARVGLAGVFFAIIASSSPLLGFVLLIGLVLLGALRPRNIIPLLFVPLLAIAWWLPILAKQLTAARWLSVLVDPGLQQSNNYQQGWQLAVFGLDSLDLTFLISAVVLALAALSLLFAKVRQSTILWSSALLALAGAWFGLGLRFDFGNGPISVDVNSALGLYGLSLILLVASAMEQNRFFVISAGVLVVALGVAPAAYSSVINPPELRYSDGRMVPSIIQAEADSGSSLRTLRLTQSEDGSVISEVFGGDGVKYHEISTKYLLLRAETVEETSDYQVLGQLVANLASANGAEILPSLQSFDIGYILVSPSNRDLQMALDSTRELESIGETDFGQLWKVRDVIATPVARAMDFGINKIAQIAVLVFFVLLSIPTSAARRRRESTSEIFVESEEA